MLRLSGVSLSYQGQLAVEDVSFSVNRGENACLVGANGSGKSTLIKGILGLMPLTAGRVELPHGAGSVGYLAQLNTAERDFPATAWEIVLSGTQRRGRRLPFYTREDKRQAQEAMALLKVEHLARRRIGSLSGGQQQRVLLARALAHRPELLILDEPCSALDPEITRELYLLFGELKEQLGLTLLLSTHDWDYVERSADRVLLLNQRLEYDGPPERWRREGGLSHE